MLELSHLTKRYGQLEALHDLSFTVRPGEIFGFVGANGAGKTTAMRVVLGVLEADAGSVIWDGSPITFAARRSIGYIPEDRGLYPKMSVIAQLEYFAQLHGLHRKAARAASTALLERFGRSRQEPAPEPQPRQPATRAACRGAGVRTRTARP
jgi:ABC-2 type transport system ATP-binding protein